jgi:predicted TPR repeat methyltransferase
VNSLDLYANIEDLLGLDEAKDTLNSYYIDTLSNHKFDSLIDIGCGKGEFLLEIKNSFNPSKLLGVDLSDVMVSYTQSLGIDAQNIDISQIDNKFEVATAVFDMLNYLDKDKLKIFLANIENILEDDGLFLLDINSLEGFEEVAVGSFIVDDDSRFLTIDSDFTNNIYSSNFTLFTKDGDRFIKNMAIINQYYHTIEEIEKLSNLKLIDTQKISLYEDVDDKILLMFKKFK